MKKLNILCTTDFSNHASLALEYAHQLALSLDAQLHILAVYQVKKTAGSFISIDDIVRENHEADMKRLVTGLGVINPNDTLPITQVLRGETVKTIIGYAKQHEIDLIVMGTQGGNSLRTILFGSTTKAVVKNSPIPVLAIPELAEKMGSSNKMLLALDDKVIENTVPFNVPKAIAQKLNSKIDILHIERKDEPIPFDPFISEHLGENMGEVYIEKGKDVIEEIKRYTEENNIGILMMIRREKSFLQSLLTVANTAAELSSTNTPLMIIPES